MRLLLVSAFLLAFATPVLADGGCDWGKSQSVQAPAPSTVVEAPVPSTVQMRTVPSSPDVATRRPSGDHAAARTRPS